MPAPPATSINFRLFNQSQVAQLMSAYIKGARRFRTHRLVLPLGHSCLSPSITTPDECPQRLHQQDIRGGRDHRSAGPPQSRLGSRERDPAIYGWDLQRKTCPLLCQSTGSPPSHRLIEGWSCRKHASRTRWLDRGLHLTGMDFGTAAVDALSCAMRSGSKATAQIVLQRHWRDRAADTF